MSREGGHGFMVHGSWFMGCRVDVLGVGLGGSRGMSDWELFTY